MKSDPLGLGIVGVGTVTLRGLLAHLTLPDVSHRVRVTALCDPVVERARQAADRYGIQSAYADLEALLDDPAVDAVTIASPIGLHYEQGRVALESGKHVHANKTLTTTVAEANHLIALAGGRNLKIVASPGEILRPHISRTRELIASGAIGDVAWVICGGHAWRHHESEPERIDAPGGAVVDPGWYFRKPGGGPMYDITVYSLHQLTSVLGPARRVTALSGIRIRQREFARMPITTEADDNTILLLDFGDGLFAVVYGTAVGTLSEQWGAVTYFGTEGTIEGALLNGKPFDFPGRELVADRPVSDFTAYSWLLPDVVGPHREILEAHVFQDIMELVDWVRDDIASPVTAEHARHVVDIIESGYRSAETGTAQELTTTFALPEA